MRIAYSPGFTTTFTSLALTILLRGWPQQKQPFRLHFAFVQMLAKRISREHGIFIMATSITIVLWLSWKLPARVCPITRRYSSCRLTSRGVRRAGKNPLETSRTPLNSTRAVFERWRRSLEIMHVSDVTPKQNRWGIAY